MPDGGTGDYASRTEVAELRRQLRELRAIVAQLVRRRADPDSRLPDLLRMVYAFSRDRPWSASELLADARRAAPDLWILLDQITGQNGSAPIKLGLWLARHGGSKPTDCVSKRRAARTKCVCIASLRSGSQLPELP